MAKIGSVLKINFLFLGLVILLIALTKVLGLKSADLFLNPFFSPRPNVALLTRTFQLLCGVPVIVCTFSYGLLKTVQTPRREHEFIFYSALLTGGFLLNEIYRIHIYMIKIGIPKLGVSLLYAIILFFYGWAFQRQLRSTPYRMLLTGVALLFFAIAIDAINLTNHNLASLLEGVPKLLSEINIDFYYWWVCQSLVEKSLTETADKDY